MTAVLIVAVTHYADCELPDVPDAIGQAERRLTSFNGPDIDIMRVGYDDEGAREVTEAEVHRSIAWLADRVLAGHEPRIIIVAHTGVGDDAVPFLHTTHGKVSLEHPLRAIYDVRLQQRNPDLTAARRTALADRAKDRAYRQLRLATHTGARPQRSVGKYAAPLGLSQGIADLFRSPESHLVDATPFEDVYLERWLERAVVAMARAIAECVGTALEIVLKDADFETPWELGELPLFDNQQIDGITAFGVFGPNQTFYGLFVMNPTDHAVIAGQHQFEAHTEYWPFPNPNSWPTEFILSGLLSNEQLAINDGDTYQIGGATAAFESAQAPIEQVVNSGSLWRIYKGVVELTDPAVNGPTLAWQELDAYLWHELGDIRWLAKPGALQEAEGGDMLPPGPLRFVEQQVHAIADLNQFLEIAYTT